MSKTRLLSYVFLFLSCCSLVLRADFSVKASGTWTGGVQNVKYAVECVLSEDGHDAYEFSEDIEYPPLTTPVPSCGMIWSSLPTGNRLQRDTRELGGRANTWDIHVYVAQNEQVAIDLEVTGDREDWEISLVLEEKPSELVGNLEFNTPGTHRFQIVATPIGQRLTLAPGWNLVTPTVTLSGASNAKLQDCVAMTMTAGRYVKATTFIPGTGYWIFNPGKEKLELELAGVKPTQAELKIIRETWMLHGIVDENDLPPELGTAQILTWKGTTWSWQQVPLEPGKAYMIWLDK